MPLNFPKVIGHRGAAGYAPENSLESIKTAADLGVKWIELDVKLTKDEVPIIFHDDSLDRTTNAHGNVKDMLFEDIKQLECGSWYGESFSGIAIPSLEEVIELLINLDLGLNLEIKACEGREVETAEVALDLLSHYWDNHDNLLISSFSHVSLQTAMDVANDWHRGFLMEGEIPENWKDLADFLDVSTINIDGNKVTKEQVEEFMEFEKPILAYTINDPMKARELQRWGVDGFFSDTPDIIVENLIDYN